MKSKLLEKYFKNRCSGEEIEILFKWVKEESDDSETKLLLQELWDYPQSGREVYSKRAQQRLDKIHHKINLKYLEEQTKNNNSFKPTKTKVYRLLYRAAVILLLPLLTLFVYTRYFQQSEPIFTANESPVMNEIVSPIGSRISLELSDGTKVWLNHGSSLQYPQRFTGKKRTVKLTGEGYFEVAHNKNKPFNVETNVLNVTALGTKFNVKAYPDDKTFSTTLVSGKIEVESAKKTIDMHPNQHFELNLTTNKFGMRNVNPEKYVSWKDGKLIFKDDNFENVAERLSRWYNVKIEIIDPEIRELTYTATFIDESLYQILEMLAVVTPIHYQISRRHKLPDGTYSKRIIKVYLKG